MTAIRMKGENHMAKTYYKGYEGYVKKYLEAEKKLIAQGAPGMWDRMYSREEFKAVFEATRSDLTTATTKRPNVIRAMINAQKYAQTEKQVWAIYRGAKMAGMKDVKLRDVRLGNVRPQLSKDYQELKDTFLAEGATEKEAVRRAKAEVEWKWFRKLQDEDTGEWYYVRE